MDFKIDRNIPAPTPQPRRKYPALEAGESVFLEGANGTSIRNAYAQRYGFGKTIARTVIESGAKGVRVWRTK